MKISIQFLLLIILFISCKTEKNHSQIEFLDKKHGAIAILDESLEPYFSQLQIKEIEAFTNSKVPDTTIETARYYARERFASAVIEFTLEEKECINYVVKKANHILKQNNLGLMANHPWQFIKIEDWLCGGFAHTRGTYIILSQRHLDHLTKTWSNNMSNEDEIKLMERLGGLLVHEQMHSLQRTYPAKFEKLYTQYWDFVKAKVTSDQSITINQVSNPDAPIAEWLIPDSNKAGRYYWIRTLFKETGEIPVMGKDFTEKVFIVENIDNNYQLVRNVDTDLVTLNLDDIKSYTDPYVVTRGIDHPNEISAYLFADYFKILLTGKADDEKWNKPKVKAFTDWVENEMN